MSASSEVRRGALAGADDRALLLTLFSQGSRRQRRLKAVLNVRMFISSVEVSSLHGSQELNSGHQALWQEPGPSELPGRHFWNVADLRYLEPRNMKLFAWETLASRIPGVAWGTSGPSQPTSSPPAPEPFPSYEQACSSWCGPFVISS